MLYVYLYIHPLKLQWHLEPEISPCKRKDIHKPPFFGFSRLSFAGGAYFHFSNPISSMGLEYLPRYIYYQKPTIHLGKYTSPMDGMGYILAFFDPLTMD